MKLARLLLLVAVLLVPAAICATVASLLLRDERDLVERNAIGRARSAMSAIDAHLRGTILALQTLAASRNLEAGDFAAFHAEAQRVMKGDPAWVNLSLISPTRQVLFNAVYAYGKPELPPSSNDSLEATGKGTRVAVGDVRTGNVVRNPTVRVNVPVLVKGAPGYVLVAPMNMKQIADVLHAQKLPEAWTITLIDRSKQVIASIPPLPTGTPVDEVLGDRVARAPEAWSRITSSEGAPLYVGHVSSELSGWALAIAIPPSYVEGNSQRSYTILITGILLALLYGAALAWFLARRRSPALGA